MPLSAPNAILFDLDGTLADTAPDLAAAINRVKIARGLPPTPYELLRPVASAGARGLISVAFDLMPEHDGYDALRTAFFDEYIGALAVESRLFDGIDALLQTLARQGLKWGIVTNKSSRFSVPLILQIGLDQTQCLVCGDTTSHSKPHPAPLLEAAHRLGLPADQCWYVGDDLRDIQAGRAAGMPVIAAAWGYCGNIEPHTWNADAIVETPADLLDLICHQM